MLYCVVAEEQYNLAYFFVKRIQCARATPTTNLPYGMFLTRLYRHVMETYPHLDNGIYDIVERARHSVSSSSSHHQGTSSHQHDDDDDDDDETSVGIDTQRKQWVTIFYFPPKNKIVVARYAEFFEKNLITQEVSGRAMDLEEIQDEDTSPSKITSEIPIEVEGFEPPQEEVILVRRSERTHRAPNRLCLNVEAEEHSLGDLNEPTSYKAAMLDSESTKAILLDPEFDKWLDAMNGEILKRLIGLSQSAYMDKILKRFRMDTSKRGNIPMQERLYLNKTQGPSTPEEVKRMQNVPYALAVGSIMYAIRCTRPDVAFTQNITSRFQQNPGEPHWTAMKTILKYLRNTKDMFLVYGGNPEAEL
ncbi:hypothetical protein Tco_1086692 [Tanacetum coccineum]